jgi:hypothetical protein
MHNLINTPSFTGMSYRYNALNCHYHRHCRSRHATILLLYFYFKDMYSLFLYVAKVVFIK